MSKLIDLTGKKYGKLTVIKISPDSSNSHKKWLCKCECGNLTSVLGYNLKNGNTQSCGCFQRDCKKNSNKYDLSGEYGKCYFYDGDFFIFDLDDYDLLKEYTWCKGSRGYAITSTNNKNTSAHRVIMNCPDGKVVDHINHNTRDNRKSNLRICTVGENNINKRPFSRREERTGIRYDKGRWRAYITLHNTDINLGSYKNKEQAIQARENAEKEYFGEFAYKGEEQ